MEAKMLSTGTPFLTLPKSYIRPVLDRPKLSQVIECKNVPIIDLSDDHSNWPQIVQQIGRACSLFGFFQVINHGVPVEVMEKMLEVAEEFNRLPVEEKMKLYSDDPTKTVRLCTSFNVRKDKVRSWRDFLRLHCYPLDQYTPDWPSNPASFKEIVSRYCKEVRELGFKIEGMISESLGLEKDYIKNALGEQGQHMVVNYYPPCPQPELTYGLPEHTDPNTLTILLQDPRVAGLQVLKDGVWLDIKPYPGALVINIGDQLQAVSNGKYKSVWHRAIVNAENERVSVASFVYPGNGAVIGPAKPLTEDGSIYRSYTYEEYYRLFWSRELDQDHCLELFKN